MSLAVSQPNYSPQQNLSQTVKPKSPSLQIGEQKRTVASGTTAYASLSCLCTALLLVQSLPKAAKYVNPSLNVVNAGMYTLGLTFGAGVLATVSAIAGAAGLYSAWSQDNTECHIQKLLTNTESLNQIISTLAEKNQDACKQAETHLSSIENTIEQMHNRISEIQYEIDGSLEDIAEEKKACLKKHAKALNLYARAKKHFESAQAINKEVVQVYQGMSQKLNRLIEILESPTQEEEDFESLKDEAVSIATELREKLDLCHKKSIQVDHHMSCGMELYSKMNKVNQQVSEKVGSLLERIEGKFNLLSSQVKGLKTDLDKIKKDKEAVQKQIHTIKQNCADQQKISKRVKENLERVAKAVKDLQMGLCIAVGALTALAVSSFIGLGIALSSGAGVIGGVSVHNRETLNKKMLDAAFGAAVANCAIPTSKNPVVYAFDDRSSGVFGCLMKKKRSNTVGTIQICLTESEAKVGDILKFRFNLNEVDAISPQDIEQLLHRMGEKLQKNELSPEKCLKIIQTLENIPVGDRKGFVSTPLLDELKRNCENLVDLHKKGQNLDGEISQKEKTFQEQSSKLQALEEIVQKKHELELSLSESMLSVSSTFEG